jgi:hypothetical protein
MYRTGVHWRIFAFVTDDSLFDSGFVIICQKLTALSSNVVEQSLVRRHFAAMGRIPHHFAKSQNKGHYSGDMHFQYLNLYGASYLAVADHVGVYLLHIAFLYVSSESRKATC